MNVLVFSAFCYDFSMNFFTIILYTIAVKLSCLYLHDSENWPPVYQQAAAIAVELIMVLIVYLIVTRIGFWYVQTIVKMESQHSLLDSVEDCIVLVDPKTDNEIFVNKAAKEMAIKAEGVTSFRSDIGEQRSSFPLSEKAFAHLDKRVFMQNLLDMEATIEELE